jgi:8-oxo-dGTP pyrophosphatase MutT (NUDIX family)
MGQTDPVPLSWAESYMGQLRTLAGDDQTLILVGTACVLRDDAGAVLLIKRSDNGAWSLPAGAMELGETLRDCAIREVLEETGLVATSVTPFAIYSRPYDVPNLYGHTYQNVALACRIDEYSETLARVTEETTDAGYFAPDAFPEGTRRSVGRVLADLARFESTGEFIVD